MTAGARYGYLLVWVVVLGNVMAWLIQYMSAKLGLVTGKSLPELIGMRIRRPWARRAYWAQAELVAMATDIAEVLGGAIALNLLFGLPLVVGGLITGAVSMALLLVQSRNGARMFEFVVIGLVAIIAIGFTFGVVVGPPSPGGVVGGSSRGSKGATPSFWPRLSSERRSCRMPSTLTVRSPGTAFRTRAVRWPAPIRRSSFERRVGTSAWRCS